MFFQTYFSFLSQCMLWKIGRRLPVVLDPSLMQSVTWSGNFFISAVIHLKVKFTFFFPANDQVVSE